MMHIKAGGVLIGHFENSQISSTVARDIFPFSLISNLSVHSISRNKNIS
jgi:hypothetical protein